MKKIIIWTILAALTVSMTACGAKENKESSAEHSAAEEPGDDVSENEMSEGNEPEADRAPYESKDNDFLANASPETSALALYQYNGAEVTREFLFDTKEVKKAVKELSKVAIKEAADWTPGKLTTPVYGVDIGGKDGYTVFGVWSNGYWITEEGVAYEYDYDFEKLINNYNWESPDSFKYLTVLPCARYLMLKDDKWYPKMMTPAPEKDAPAGIELIITKQTTDMLTAEIKNNTGEEWFFGEYFSLEVHVDGNWYLVPETPGSWAFHDIGLIIPAKESMEMEYHLIMYGDLPAGEYRLVVEDMTAEFVIE